MELPQPLPEEAEIPTMPDGRPPVILRVMQSGNRFAAPRTSLLRFSSVAANMLEDAGDDEELPLMNNHCTDDSVSRFIAWLLVHAKPEARLTRVQVPLPEEPLGMIFSPDDLAFIEEALVPKGNMRCGAALFMFLGVSVFLGAQIPQEIAAGYLAWKVREAGKQPQKSATTVIRSWFGLHGDFTGDEKRAIADKYQWCRNVDHTQLERLSREAYEHADSLKPAAAGTAKQSAAAAGQSSPAAAPES